MTASAASLADGLAPIPAERFVIDGEIVLPGQAFETLQLRLHPAAGPDRPTC